MPNWNHVLREIQKEADSPGESAADKVRMKYLSQLHAQTGRNVICYYSGWLSKPRLEGIDINDEDKNGFMLAIHQLDRSKGLDLFLHTPGGNVAAAASLVDYLRQMFGMDVRAFVPQLAMSAGTMIACSCREIFMGKHSNLGPVDPQINGIAAYSVTQEIERAYSEIAANNQRAYVWGPILPRYTPGFVQQCHWAIEYAGQIVKEFLCSNMLSHLPEAPREKLALEVVKALSEQSSTKGHDRHIHIDECKAIGLRVCELEDPRQQKLQDLVLTVHHCYMYTLANTAAFKIIENHVGKRYVKITQQVLLQLPGTPFQPAAPPQPA